MSTSTSPIARDPSGRFVPGQSGNPAGKAPGTRNRATLLRELMDEGDDAAIVRLVLDKAKGGDAVAARFVVAYLCPRPRPEGRRVEIALPEGQPAHNVVAAHDAVLRALFAGEIAPDEAEAVTRVLGARMRALAAWRMENAMMQHRPRFPVLPARAGAGQAEAAEEGNAAAPSSTCISPANAGRPTEDAAPSSGGSALPNRPAMSRDHLHSACIEQDSEAMTPERQERALALLAALTARRPPFDSPSTRGEDSA